ncbi:MAG: hypothetical protein NVS3B26_09850 [Mycobacteriales bacterium]
MMVDVPHTTLTRGVSRWGLLLAVLGLVWMLTPHPVALYDGIGFPDQPYRFAPPRAGSPAPAEAQVRLPVAGGSNTGGLVANSAEVGPQVSFYAPPHAFAVAGTRAITVTARPVPAAPPLPSGPLDSNVYVLSFTSPGGPVSLVSAAQSPAITLRSSSNAPKNPIFQYRAEGSAPWRVLSTRQVGRDVFNANAPGAGQYVLVEAATAAGAPAKSHGGLYTVLGATVALMLLVLIGVRVLARRAAQP